MRCVDLMFDEITDETCVDVWQFYRAFHLLGPRRKPRRTAGAPQRIVKS